MNRSIFLIIGIIFSILVGVSIAVITFKNSNANVGEEKVAVNLQDKKVDEIKEVVPENKENDNTKEELNKMPNEDLTKEKNVKFNISVIADSERSKSEFGFDRDVLVTFDRVLSWNPELILFTGDIIMINADSAGRTGSVQGVKNIFDKYFKNIPYYIAFGNHDIEGDEDNVDLWQKIFFNKVYKKGEERVLYHSFDYENTHFALLSTGFPLKNDIDAKQLQWLEDDLKKNIKENTIIVMHAPPITFFEKSAKRCHDLSCHPQTQAKLQAIFKENKVDLVVSGHEHVFDHKIVDGIDYIIGGNSSSIKSRYKEISDGQTFADIAIENNSITVTGIDVNKGIIRTIKIK